MCQPETTVVDFGAPCIFMTDPLSEPQNGLNHQQPLSWIVSHNQLFQHSQLF